MTLLHYLPCQLHTEDTHSCIPEPSILHTEGHQRLSMREIREKCDTLLIYLGNNVFGELHKRPYTPFLHRSVDVLIVQQLRPVDRESRYDGQPLN